MSDGEPTPTLVYFAEGSRHIAAAYIVEPLSVTVRLGFAVYRATDTASPNSYNKKKLREIALLRLCTHPVVVSSAPSVLYRHPGEGAEDFAQRLVSSTAERRRLWALVFGVHGEVAVHDWPVPLLQRAGETSESFAHRLQSTNRAYLAKYPSLQLTEERVSEMRSHRARFMEMRRRFIREIMFTERHGIEDDMLPPLPPLVAPPSVSAN